MAKEEMNVVAVEQAPAPKYKVIGLAISKSMPIEHKGLRYDLAALTDQQLEILIAEKCPYVTKS